MASLREALAGDRDALLGPAQGRMDVIRHKAAFLVNPSLRACLLLRVTIALPPWARFMGRTLMIALHRMDLELPISIAPGLRLPEPTGVVLGRIDAGRDLTIHENVTFGGARPDLPSMPVGDRVTIHAGSTVLVDREQLPSDSVIEAGSFIYRSVWSARGIRRVLESGDRPPVVPPSGSTAKLLYADYIAATRRKPVGAIGWLALAARFIANPSLHALVLLRLGRDEGPPPRRLWRSLLRRLHGIDLQDDVQIAGGFEIPHPFNITFGAGCRIGYAAKIGHDIEIGAGAVLADRAFVYPKCRFAPGVTVGERALISSFSDVDASVPEDGTFRGRRPTGTAGIFTPLPD